MSGLSGCAGGRPEAAEVIAANTCGFIDAAKEESVDTIRDGGACARAC
ncbi:MAG: hypothetical protein H6726_30925 [Sandaracinaceae bacterium]|nr:hypothetical protein [Sandaracinaceae bacterium]